MRSLIEKGGSEASGHVGAARPHKRTQPLWVPIGLDRARIYRFVPSLLGFARDSCSRSLVFHSPRGPLDLAPRGLYQPLGHQKPLALPALYRYGFWFRARLGRQYRRLAGDQTERDRGSVGLWCQARSSTVPVCYLYVCASPGNPIWDR